MMKYTEGELKKIEEAVDGLPEHVQREVCKTPRVVKDNVSFRPKKPQEEKKKSAPSDSDFLIPPPV
jgi:hypothetical protein